MKWYEDPEYQLMCEGAEEIQETWKPRIGDLMFARNLSLRQPRIYLLTHFIDNNGKDASSGRIVVYNIKTFQDCCDSNIGELKKYFVYLPSQEDLQEIYCKYFKWNWAQMERHFHEWIFTCWTEVWDSREKALLAFVMDKLYKKQWNPEKKIWEEIK